jgi:hypothetical protein
MTDEVHPGPDTHVQMGASPTSADEADEANGVQIHLCGELWYHTRAEGFTYVSFTHTW